MSRLPLHDYLGPNTKKQWLQQQQLTVHAYILPGVAPTVQALALFKLLISELFPTLGIPTTPTLEKYQRFWCFPVFCLSTTEPLPKFL